MPGTFTHPGTYREEVPSGARSIQAAPTSICVFVGRTARGPLAVDGPTPVRSFDEFERDYGGWHPGLSLPHAVHSFFSNGGRHALIARLRASQGSVTDPPDDSGEGGPLSHADYLGDAEAGSGLHALRRTELFNLLCVPPDVPDGDTSPVVYQAALALCVEHRAMLLVDPPAAWSDANSIAHDHAAAVTALGLSGRAARNAALYFPRLLQHEAGSASPVVRVPCGAVAGVMARTDGSRGVWKAPAGAEAGLREVVDLAVHLADAEIADLNPCGVTALRRLVTGQCVIWGARTLGAADAAEVEYKYVPVRRTALHIEHSVVRGIAWAVFEPNGETLWAQLSLRVGAFLHSMFRQGAFQGSTPREAYFVKCDAQTTTQDERNRGVCTLVIGFAPLKLSEFVVLRLAQRTAVPGV